MSNLIPIINTKEFFNIVNNNDLAVFDFFTEWCGPCVLQKEEFNKNGNKMFEKYPKIKVAKIDADNDDGLFSSFGLDHIPTIVVIYKKEFMIMDSGNRTVDFILTATEKFIDFINKKTEKIDPNTVIDEKYIKKTFKQIETNSKEIKKNLKQKKNKK
jgi:thiol-disulfide isomerase/thioredoxin